MSKGEKIFQLAVTVFIVLLAGIVVGYGWRMAHEGYPNPTGIINLKDLNMEISKGKEIWLPIDDNTMLHFLPLRGARYEMAIRREKR